MHQRRNLPKRVRFMRPGTPQPVGECKHPRQSESSIKNFAYQHLLVIILYGYCPRFWEIMLKGVISIEFAFNLAKKFLLVASEKKC
jgi:hypothetical protein